MNIRPKEKECDNSTSKTFFSTEGVGNRGNNAIEIRFETLIASKCDLPWDWYKDLGIDKSDASKIRRGLLIPAREWRIRIANYFKVDSSTIWKARDIVDWEASK